MSYWSSASIGNRQRAGGWGRRVMVSALTLLGLDERMAAYASYETLADIVRARFTAPTETLQELFSRMTFNILVGNTDRVGQCAIFD